MRLRGQEKVNTEGTGAKEQLFLTEDSPCIRGGGMREIQKTPLLAKGVIEHTRPITRC